MAEQVLMPKSGISVESCVVRTWYKQVGDEVKIGDILFDYETDKAVFECESTAEGVLLAILCEEGEEIKVLTPACLVGKTGEDISMIFEDVAQQAVNSAQNVLHEPTAPQTVAAANANASAFGGNRASPRARNLADKLGVDIKSAMPTGPDGRVIERDVDKLYRDSLDGAVSTAAQSAKTASESADSEFVEERMPKIRRVIADNLLSSVLNSAQLTHHHSFDASMVLNMRKSYKNYGADMGLDCVSVGDMILYAVSRTLKDYKYMNALLLENGVLRTYSAVHLGVAVDTPRGLIVPTIFNAERKSLRQISAEVRELAATARSGQINPDRLQGATFTVSNLGPTGVEVFTPIINTPQVAILGVCGVVDRVRAGVSGVEVYSSIGLSLTYDHRAVDGAPASRFAQALAKNLENFPLLLSDVQE